MNFCDKVDIAGTNRRASDGALMVDARVARTGIQLYSGAEVGKPDMSVVRVFRPADEVFSQDTLTTFAHRPVTNDHPSALVNADTWRTSNVVGHTADEVNVKANDIFVRVPLMISDGDMIADIAAGKRELSAGYTCDLDWTAGQTQSGEAYDAVQRNIRINHIAVVRNGRAGSQVKIGDSMSKTIMIDAIPVIFSDEQTAAIVEAHSKRLNDALTAAQAAVTERDTRIGQLTADLATAQGKIPTPEAVAQMIADRVALETVVKSIAPNMKIEPVMTDNALRRAVVKDRFPTLVTDATSDAEIIGMFRTLQPGQTVGDTYRQNMNGVVPPQMVADNGQSEFEKYILNASKPQTAH
jgi:hypothetical protein